MNKLEKNYIKKVQDILRLPECKRDIPIAAKLMLQGNKNIFLYNSVMLKPYKMAPKMWYCLHKILKTYHADIDKTSTADNQDTTKSLESSKELLSQKGNHQKGSKKFIGKRDDHDQLPENIKACYQQSLGIYLEIKSARADLLENLHNDDMNVRMKCTKKLKALDDQYHHLLNKYDDYISGTISEELTDKDALTLSTARAYISKNLRKIHKAKKEDPHYKLSQELIENLISRYQGIKDLGRMTDDMEAKLTEVGINLNNTK